MAAFNSPQHPKDELAPTSSFDFRVFYHTLLEKSWLVAICFVVGLLLTLGYLQRAPRIYAATVTLQVEQEEKKVFDRIQKFDSEDLRSQEVLRTIEQNLRSRPLLERVIDANKLIDNPALATEFGKPSKERLLSLLSKIIDVRLRRGTRLIDITVAHTIPDLTEKVANSLATEYRRQLTEQYSTNSGVAYSYLVDKRESSKSNLLSAEDALQAYRIKVNSASLEDQADTVRPKLKELATRVTDTETKRINLASEIARVNELSNNVAGLLVLPAVASDPVVVDRQTAVARLENEFSALQGRYGPKHSKYLAAFAQLDDAKKNLTNAVLKVPQTLRASLSATMAAEVSLREAFKAQEKIVSELDQKLIEYNRLLGEVKTAKDTYQAVLTRLNESELTKELPTEKVRVVQPAYLPGAPISPNVSQVLIRGILAGLVGGIMLVLGINSLDSSLKTVDQAEEYLRLPVLSAVPQVAEVKEGKGALIVSEDAKSPGAEGFRSLRTSLSMLGREENRRTFLFTSALPQEGKTFCSANFSLCLAQQGLRTVLIDGDLRRPAVETVLLGKRLKQIGVTDYLTGQKKLTEVIQTTDSPNFCYIPAGTTSPNPAELLAQGGMDGLIDEALQHFDRVVIDSAPVHAVSDTLLMMAKVQTVCVVVRACKTPRKGVARAIHMLKSAEAPLAGIIMNRMPRRRGRGYYYYDPYYDYSYQDRYGEKGVYGS